MFSANLPPFQFTPLREGRLEESGKEILSMLFQFTPLREGRLGALLHAGLYQRISIHAPA